MKLTKKLASLLLALVMALALCVPAFAAEDTGKITVDNAKAGHTYTAYKIFDVVYNDNKNAYSYTISSGSEWFSTVKTYAETSNNGMTLTRVNDSTVYNVAVTNAFSAPAFANALRAAVSGKTGTTLTVSAGVAVADNLPLGYYFVTSTSGSLCNLTTTNPDVTIHDKNDIPFDKTDDKESVDVGQVVTYTVTGKVPDYTGFTTYTYLITDTMSEGLTFQKGVMVTVGGTDVTKACTITYDVENNANKFTVSIPVMTYDIGAAIVVTYTAVVNEKAVGKIENNTANLTYSNDPTDASKTTTTPDEVETVYTAKLVIDKHVKDADTTKLAGAEFLLYKKGDNDSKLYYKWNDTAKKVEWVASKDDATVKTTDSNGATSFDGLADGTYYLEEIKAPAGYNLLTGPVEITINGTSAGETNLAPLTVTEKVANQSGTELPSTGGIGTTLFYIAGGVLVVGAAVLLVTKRRMER